MYHHAVTDASTDYLKLNTTDARIQTDVNYMGSTLPTSSVFSLGYNFTTNESGKNYVAYCWAEIPGYSKFGSFVGNGSSDGRFVYIGFRPAWLLIKRTDDSKSWFLWDIKRDPINLAANDIYPNQSHAENNFANNEVDLLSNGFKLRNSNSTINASGGQYIYMAFAEQPGTTPFDTFPNAR